MRPAKYCAQQRLTQCDADVTRTCYNLSNHNTWKEIQDLKCCRSLFFSPSRQIFVAAVLSSRAYSVRPDSRILYQHGKAVKNTAPKKGKRYHNGTYSVSNACWSLRSLVEAVESAGERVSESLRSPVSLPCGAKSIWRPLVQCYQCSSHFDCVGLLRRRLSKWTWVWISP